MVAKRQVFGGNQLDFANPSAIHGARCECRCPGVPQSWRDVDANSSDTPA